MNPRPALTVAAALTAGLVLSACGSSGEPTKTAETPARTPASSAPASATPAEAAGTTVKVVVKGNSISPNAEKVQVKVGEPITLDITSDREGEFHVHSTPEAEIEFGAGHKTAELKLERPGLVDVEEHASGKLLVQFEVR